MAKDKKNRVFAREERPKQTVETKGTDGFVPRDDKSESSLRAERSEAKQSPNPNHLPLKQTPARIPELRFKEFEEVWNLKSLSSSIDIVAGYAFKSTEMENKPSTYQIIKMSNVYKSKLQLDRSPSYWEKIDKKQAKFLLQKKDILLTLTGTVGKKDFGYSIVIPEDNKFLLNQRLVYMRFIENISDGDFINNLIKTKRFFYFFFNEAKGGTGNQTNVGIEDLKNIKLSFPSLPEQQKIASFLSAVDEKIQRLTKKKELLEQYKKGVMQQLFSGKLRFKPDVIARNEAISPNETNFPDWEEKIFSDLYSFHSTNSLSRDKLNYDTGLVYNIHYGDIHTKFKTAFHLNKEYIPFVNDDVDLSKIKADSYCMQGDLVMADASEDYADIGKTIELIDLKNKLVLAGLHTFLARPKTTQTVIGFFSFLLKSWDMRKQIMIIAQGTKVLSLSTGRVGKLKLKLPSIEEQQKIATYLSRIDTKIENVNQQITQTQTFKKGLLQQMFV